MTKVLAAIDNSAAARSVLHAAGAMANLLGVGFDALHVREDGMVTAEGEAHAAGVHLRVVAGSPVPEIVAAVGDDEVAMAVLALHREPGARHPAGQTALAVVAQATKPVLVVPPRGGGAGTGKLGRALVPLDGSPASTAAVRSTVRMLGGAGVEVIVVHVFDAATVPRFLDQPAHDLSDWAEEFFARHCAEPGVRLELRAGETGATLLELAVGEGIDMIALGWAQDLAPERAHVVRQVLVGSPCPVLLVPMAWAP